jgi:membrane-associated phospholipid phosphatase
MFIEHGTESKVSGPEIEQRARVAFIHGLRLVDYLTLLFIAVIGTIILLCNARVEAWYYYVAAHAAVIVFLLVFINFADRHSSRVLKLCRDTYPLVLYTFMFIEISRLLNILFPFWLESYLLDWDLKLFGSYPTVWVQQFFRPWLSEYMAFSYWSYFIIFPICSILLYLRKDKTLLYSYVFSLSFTFYFCYFSYLFLCARGPHDTIAHLHVSREVAGFFDGMVQRMQEGVSISGAAFPSSHVAATWIVQIYLFRYKKWLGWAVLPLVLSLTVSVVYLQYHYAVDFIAGMLVVAIIYPLTCHLEKKYGQHDSRFRLLS